MNNTDPLTAGDAIFDDETGETYAEALVRFAKHGSDEVSAEIALGLIKAGFEVWAFGYGDDPAEFTVVNEDDVEVFEEDVEEATRDWGPFRFDASLGRPVNFVRFVLTFADEWTASPFVDPVTSYVLRTGVDELREVGIGATGLPTRILGMSTVSRREDS